MLTKSGDFDNIYCLFAVSNKDGLKDYLKRDWFMKEFECLRMDQDFGDLIQKNYFYIDY